MKHKNRRRRGTVRIMKGPDPVCMNAEWPIGKNKFETGQCKGNKWLVPINRTLRLDLP